MLHSDREGGQMIELPSMGKGCYLWQASKLKGGDPISIRDMMKAASVDHVAIKIFDGSQVWKGLEPIFEELTSAGIACGGWGYEYLKYSWSYEAKACVTAAKLYGAWLRYLLHDFESEANYQTSAAWSFIQEVRKALPVLPMGTNSWWSPKLHPEAPFYQYRSKCDFDAPQVYTRGYAVVEKYLDSKAQYKKLFPHLPWRLPAGDMYHENGVEPKPGDVLTFMRMAHSDPDAGGCVMWAADQCETTVRLWEEFSSYRWSKDDVVEPSIAVPPPPVQKPVPLFSGVVKVDGLRKHPSPSVSSAVTGSFVRGERVDVYKTDGLWWAVDDPSLTIWGASVNPKNTQQTYIGRV
jgi:hypothetical protein